MTPPKSGVNSHRDSERLSAVERDVAHLDSQLTALSRRLEQGFEDLQRSLNNSQQPITAFAGWAAVILSLVYAFVSPMNETDARHRERLDRISERELADSFEAGRTLEKFETLSSEVEAAINNRKDIDMKHVAEAAALRDRVVALKDELSHKLDNGLGRRIREVVGPLTERIISLEREAYGGDTTEPRDMDRQ